MDIEDKFGIYIKLYPCDNCQNKCNDIFKKRECCSFNKWKFDDRDCDRLCGSCDKTHRQIPINDVKQKNLVKSWCELGKEIEKLKKENDMLTCKIMRMEQPMVKQPAHADDKE